jgi:putative ABC transport system ATP-binding protein
VTHPSKGKTRSVELSLIDQLNRGLDKTILIVTHDPKSAEKARRLVHLEKGVLAD